MVAAHRSFKKHKTDNYRTIRICYLDLLLLLEWLLEWLLLLDLLLLDLL